MSETLILTKDLIVAKGSGRVCYNHPKDFSKIIKIAYPQVFYKNQNQIENIYYNYLKKHNISTTHIVKCYGYINTNLGKGLIFDKVCDYTGDISLYFTQYLDKVKNGSRVSLKNEESLVKELEKYILENNILFVDISLKNVLLCEYEQGKYKLIIIDGLGGTVLPRFIIQLFIKPYQRYKIKKMCKMFVNKFYSRLKKY